VLRERIEDLLRFEAVRAAAPAVAGQLPLPDSADTPAPAPAAAGPEAGAPRRRRRRRWMRSPSSRPVRCC
jgi:hypothetical protein